MRTRKVIITAGLGSVLVGGLGGAAVATPAVIGATHSAPAVYMHATGAINPDVYMHAGNPAHPNVYMHA